MCAFSFSATVCAAPGEMHIDHPQEGVTEGWVEEETVPANQKSIAQAQTLSIDNNHAYWRVDENMK